MLKTKQVENANSSFRARVRERERERAMTVLLSLPKGSLGCLNMKDNAS